MSKNICYARFVFILNKTQRKTCFACEGEAVSIQNFHINCTVWRNSLWKFCTYCWSLEHWWVS